MKILQSTIERMLYILLVFVFVTFTFAAFYAYKNNQAIKSTNAYFHNQNVANLKLIEQNQAVESLAIKTYIACLLTLNPKGNTSIQVQEQICFNKAPAIKT
jgi:D-alanyl-lipoteichoic acid acyltransferase DltB (MBOAT superfamily)